MIRKGMTHREAAEEWVHSFDAIPQGMIEKLMRADPEDWHEVTRPSVGDRVYCGSGTGEIVKRNSSSGRYKVKLDNGGAVWRDEEQIEVEYDDALPMWGTMWSFGDSCDAHWLDDDDGIRLMSDCGFRIFESEEFGYFFGIDGAGYDFYEQHWIPLYKARGLHWHDPVAEEKAEMEGKGYHRGKLGLKEYWLDAEGQVIKEVAS